MESKRVTLRTIAAAAGLSVQAVSLALRNRREIARATRARVKKVAEELGYRPDPALRALAEYRTARRKVAAKWNEIALVHDWLSPEKWLANPFYQDLVRELRLYARERGIAIREEWLGHRHELAKTVFRRLRDIGVTGLLIAPPPLDPDPMAIPVPKRGFQTVTFGPEHLYPNLHTVQFDFYENLRLAWAVLRKRGSRRIGLLYAAYQGWRTGDAWIAAHYIEKRAAGFHAEDLPPLAVPGTDDASFQQFRQWATAQRLDAVISSVHPALAWSRTLKPAPRVAIMNVGKTGESGIDLNLRQTARTAIELLLLEMQRSLVAESALPFRIHIPGRWVD